ncbi:MAG TPA: glycosyltransferase family A protein [Thermoanaerobaculia bacterium]|jgi:glycosyltransferase involved in cell wall biosynthesis
MPFFSVIIPMYNRAAFIGRAIDSVLSQDDADFEVVVVDDGSADDSVAAVRRYTDPRVRLVLSPVNQGRCPARNLGMKHAVGEWFVFLDSDDELTPGALRLIRARIEAAPPTVGAMRFMCVSDTGERSPEPPHSGQIVDYAGFLRWAELSLKATHTEAMPCVKATTFPAVQYPSGHADEGRYHLDIARLVETQLAPDVVRLYHHDAPQRVMHANLGRILRYAPDLADDAAQVLGRHGEAMRRTVPDLYYVKVMEAVSQSFLAGRRFTALRYATRLTTRPRFWARLSAVTGLGMLGPRAAAWAKKQWMRMQGRKAA